MTRTNRYLYLLTIVFMLSLSFAATVAAQTASGPTASIPFDFWVGGTHMPRRTIWA